MHARSPAIADRAWHPDNGCLYGVQNYTQAATNYPDFWPAVRAQPDLAAASSSFIATPLGMLFAVIIDRGHPRQPHLPDASCSCRSCCRSR